MLLLLSHTPIENTLQLQFRVAVQQASTFSNIHNLVIFNWGDPPSTLQNAPLSASYFPDEEDPEIIHSLSQRDGRIYADDQPLPKWNVPDPDFKGNKWMIPTKK